MKRLCAVATVAVLGAVGAASAQAAPEATWYWAPSYCKSQLNNKGVAIGDGRYFYPAQSYCIGWGGEYCEWYGGERQYRRFSVAMRTNDGVVRGMILNTTGRYTWRGSNLRIIARGVSYSSWRANYGDVTWRLAQEQNERGCRG